jgi:hypothetical protein
MGITTDIKTGAAKIIQTDSGYKLEKEGKTLPLSDKQAKQILKSKQK